jgi:hypothetical protein
MDLQDKAWKKVNGGRKTLYDASVPLQRMEQTNDPAQVAKIWQELWDNLHHQGNVGIASYLALPQLVRIAKEKKMIDWNIFGLCSLIEQQRHERDNPDLPAVFQQYYQEGLTELSKLALESLKTDQEDDTMFVTALAVIATSSGRTRLGKAILQLEDEELMEEFLEK